MDSRVAGVAGGQEGPWGGQSSLQAGQGRL